MLRNPLLIAIMLIVVLFPAGMRAGMNLSLDQASVRFASNDVGDIVYMVMPDGDTVIWVGTGNRLSKTTDRGASWFTYDQRNGLNQNEISALAVSGTTLWAATAYYKLVEGELIPYGRGFNKTEDFGETWYSFIPQQVDYAGMIAYDIAIDETLVWAACWYGGLLRSQDGGQTWENVFVDSFAQKDFEEGRFQHLNNRFFAVVVDTVCPIEKKLKNSINDIAYDGKLIWVATQNGLHSSIDLGKTWFAYDTTSGLNSNGVFCLAGDTSFFWVGLYDGVASFQPHFIPLSFLLTGAGFNYTTDFGATWDTTRPEQASSQFRFARSIAMVDTVVWAACHHGGLIRSFNRGESWENVFVDTSAERRYMEERTEFNDVFTCIAVDTSLADTLVVWSGTENGLYKFLYSGSDSADTVMCFLEGTEHSPQAVLSLGVQNLDGKSTVWVNTAPGGVWYPSPLTYKSTDGGETWTSYLSSVWVWDFAFQDSVVWAASYGGLRRTRDGGMNWDTFEIVDSSGQLIIPSQFTSVCVVPDTLDTIIFVGSIDGLAKSTDDGKTWQVIKFAHSFKKAIWAGSAAGIYKFIYNYRDVSDTVLNYNSYMHNITGDWVVSLAIQEYDEKKVIWAGTQPTYSGEHGASFSTDDGDTWEVTLLGDRVWNFAFDDSVVWTATGSGLKRSYDWGENWEVFNFMKDKEEITENRIFSSEFTSVAIIDREVWAGNADGLVKSQDNGASWDVFRTAVAIGNEGSKTAYAYPSPFSPVLESGQVVRIHYLPRQDGPVTIKIYDFAMNLVITLVDGQHRIAGVEYDEPWDGKNEEDDLVANGVYFFKVEAPGGQTEWGKLVILK